MEALERPEPPFGSQEQRREDDHLPWLWVSCSAGYNSLKFVPVQWWDAPSVVYAGENRFDYCGRMVKLEPRSDLEEAIVTLARVYAGGQQRNSARTL